MQARQWLMQSTSLQDRTAAAPAVAAGPAWRLAGSVATSQSRGIKRSPLTMAATRSMGQAGGCRQPGAAARHPATAYERRHPAATASTARRHPAGSVRPRPCQSHDRCYLGRHPQPPPRRSQRLQVGVPLLPAKTSTAVPRTAANQNNQGHTCACRAGTQAVCRSESQHLYRAPARHSTGKPGDANATGSLPGPHIHSRRGEGSLGGNSQDSQRSTSLIESHAGQQ